MGVDVKGMENAALIIAVDFPKNVKNVAGTSIAHSIWLAGTNIT